MEVITHEEEMAVVAQESLEALTLEMVELRSMQPLVVVQALMAVQV
jgi:hypothetical protein